MITNLKPKFVTDTDKKTSVLLKKKITKTSLKCVGNLKDVRDLLKAEYEASSFLPYEVFREKLLAATRHKPTLDSLN